MALDLSLKDVIKGIGHDGSEILWPELPEPIRRRAFHIEELQYFCRDRGYLLVEYTAKIMYNPGGDKAVEYDFEDKWKLILEKHSGLLLGRYKGRTNAHAVAWNAQEGLIYDPSGHVSGLPEFVCESFYATIRAGV